MGTNTRGADGRYEFSAACEKCAAALGAPCVGLPDGEIHTVRYFALPLEAASRPEPTTDETAKGGR